jgi:hypothetical protein
MNYCFKGSSSSEAIDFMRQSGLANRISPKDLVVAAGNMIRRTLSLGDLLFVKGEIVKSMYLIVSGEILFDISYPHVDPNLGDSSSATSHLFSNPLPENCFHLGSGSILGEEGVTGLSNTFGSTAVVVSTGAVVFEVVGFGMEFIAEKIQTLRYCALAYKDRSRWTTPLSLAEQSNPYSYFNSMRKCVSTSRIYRGVQFKLEDKFKTVVIKEGDENIVVVEDESEVIYRKISRVNIHRAVDVNRVAKEAIKTLTKKYTKVNYINSYLIFIFTLGKYIIRSTSERIHCDFRFRD